MHSLTFDSNALLPARRNNDYRINNIAAPLPTAMTPSDYEKGKAMVVSHPGWHRYSLFPKYAVGYAQEMDVMRTEMEDIVQDPCCSPKMREALMVQLSQVYWNLRNELYLYNELKIESALEAATRSHIPIIMTVPCIYLETGGKNVPRFQADDNLARDFVPYVNHCVQERSSVYVLPTMLNRGFMAGDGGRTDKDARTYARTAEGKELFGKCATFPWNTVFAVGGYVDGCLGATLSYFTNAQQFEFIDDFCFHDPRQTLTTSPEMYNLISTAMTKLHISPKKQTIRNSLLQMMRPQDVFRQPLERYKKVSYLGNNDANAKISVRFLRKAPPVDYSLNL